MKLKENKEQAQKKTPENYVVRLLAYVHRRKQNENILLVKMNYKYCGILTHYLKSQYTQTRKTLITQEFIKLLILSTITTQQLWFQFRQSAWLQFCQS